MFFCNSAPVYIGRKKENKNDRLGRGISLPGRSFFALIPSKLFYKLLITIVSPIIKPERERCKLLPQAPD